MANILERKWVLLLLGLVAGVALGVLYAWQINPVKWVDGEPHQLRVDLREDYMRMLLDSYTVNRDSDLATRRYQALGEYAQQALLDVAEDPGEVSPTSIQGLRALVEIEGGLTPEPGATSQPGTTSEPGTTPQPTETATGPLPTLRRLVLPVCGVTLLLAVLLAGALVLRSRSRSEEPAFETALEGEAPMESPTGMRPVTAAPGGEDSLATFRTIYTIGDDDYDDSFSIESPTGEFLGECGVGVGDLIGVGEPKKVSAFEVWLFDKNDIQTVTKVLMSGYTYRDVDTRDRLAAKGDPVTAEPGGVISLRTASLEVEARVVDMSYGMGALPAESYFERLTIELRAWSRNGTTG
jgi:hypothetical protein